MTGLGVDLAEHLGGNLDQETVQVAGVPLGEHLGDRGRGQTQSVAQQLVGLTDELHIGVLDPVVHHLDEVSGAVRPDVRAAGNAVDVSRDLLQQRTQRRIGLTGATGHDRRSVKRALLAAGDARSDEMQSAIGHRLFTADGVGVQRVAPVDDDVAGFHRVGEFVDHRVGGVTGLHHDQHPSRSLQRGEEFRDGLRSHE